MGRCSLMQAVLVERTLVLSRRRWTLDQGRGLAAAAEATCGSTMIRCFCAWQPAVLVEEGHGRRHRRRRCIPASVRWQHGGAAGPQTEEIPSVASGRRSRGSFPRPGRAALQPDGAAVLMGRQPAAVRCGGCAAAVRCGRRMKRSHQPVPLPQWPCERSPCRDGARCRRPPEGSWPTRRPPPLHLT